MIYFVNGLALASDQALPGLQSVPSAGVVDVQVHFQPSSAEFGTSREHIYYRDASVTAARGGNHFRLIYADGIEFLLNAGGDQVHVHSSRGVPFDVAAAYFTGPVLGLVLRIRGVLCLHASAVENALGGFALCGARGAGKSTLAATFALAQDRVLSDDVVALERQPDGFAVPPSWSRFKLWPDSVQALYGNHSDFPRLDSESEKRVVYPLPLPPRKPALLRTVYLMNARSAETTTAWMESVDPRDAMLSLASHTYANYLLTPEMRRVEFEQLQQLMKTISVRKLTIPNDYSALPAVREALLADFAEQSRGTVRSC